MKRLSTLIYIGAIMFCLPVMGQNYNFDGLTSGASGTLANGWVASPAAGFHWRANTGTTTSTGTGPSADHTLGTALGVYMYTEASSPALPGDTASLTSPNINTAGTSFPGIGFWYHRFGGSMSPLYIDIYANGVWTLAVDSLTGQQHTAETQPYLYKTLNLAAYAGGIVQVRFRSVRGANWDSDMAIDDVALVSIDPHDAELLSYNPTHYYTKVPLAQLGNIGFEGMIKNVGGDSITGLSINASINGAITLSSTGQTLYSDSVTNLVTNTYLPTSLGTYFVDIYTQINETDANPVNDSGSYEFEVTDTIMARENDNITQGIGFTGGTGIFGQMFELTNDDSLTSVSFKLTGPTIGDYYKMKLYHWDDVAGVPGIIIDSTALTLITSDSNMWYTKEFTCDRILTAGKYFFAVEQTGTNNLTFGYTSAYYEPGVTWFDGGAGWTSFESVGFNVSLAIRPNFGPASWPTINLGPDVAICSGSSITLSAGPGFNAYTWSDASTDSTLIVNVEDTLWVTVYNSSGCAARDTIIVTVDSVPDVWIPATAGICDNTPTTLVAHNNPNYTYVWSDGSTDSTLTTSTPGTVHVTVTDATGCSSTGFTFLNQNTSPTADITNGDTISYCAGAAETVIAAGSGNVYDWSNGGTGNVTAVSAPGWLYLTVTSPFGCSSMDSAWVVEVPAPQIMLSDTALSFCENGLGIVSLTPEPGATYNWSDGSNGFGISFSSGGVYTVTATLGGCTAVDSVVATELPAPMVNLGADTTICDTATLELVSGYSTGVAWSTGDTSSTISVTDPGVYSVQVTGSNGCSDADTINVNVDICASVNEYSPEDFEIYPVPMEDWLQVKLPSALTHGTWTIVSTSGMRVARGKISGNAFQLNVSDLPSGSYFIEFIQNGRNVYSQALIK